MADSGVPLNVGSGGKVVDTETLSPRGFDVQRVKIVTGNVDVDGGDTSPTNPLSVELYDANNNPFPVPPPLTNDAPGAMSIVGDPSGPYAGVNILEAVMDSGTGEALNVRIFNPEKRDAQNATILSDAPAPINIYGALNQFIVIDTTGYESINITTQALAGNITCSNDGVTWSALTGVPLVLGAYVTAVAANLGYSFPCLARYFRITVTAAGTAVAYLRAQPWPGTYTTSVPTATATNNVASWNGTAIVTAGVAGTLSVGGNIAVGSAPTLNPVPLAWDGTNTRRILTDTSSGGVVLGSNATTNGQTIGQTIITATTAAVTQVKASAGRLTMLYVSNGAANVGYLHMQNNSAATTSTASVLTIAIPATAGASIPVFLPEGGLYFSSGIAYTVSGAIASGDTTALTSPSIAVNYAYI